MNVYTMFVLGILIIMAGYTAVCIHDRVMLHKEIMSGKRNIIEEQKQLVKVLDGRESE